SQPPLQSASPLPSPSPYTEQSGGLTERREPTSRPVSPFRTARRVPRLRPPLVPVTHAMTLCPSCVPLHAPLPASPESFLPEAPDPESDRAHAASPTVSGLLSTSFTDPSFESAVVSALVAEQLDFAATCRLDYTTALVAESESARPPSVGGECALSTDILEDRQEDFESIAAAVPCFASMLLTREGDPDAPDIPTPRSYTEAITGPYSSQWPAAMDTEMASWNSTDNHVDEVPPPGANIVDGMWIFRVKRPPGSPPAFKAPRKLHDTLRTTLAALGFAPATAEPSLFLRTDTSLPPFYVHVYVNDLVFATTDTKTLTLMKSELQKRHTCTDLGELRNYLGLQITRLLLPSRHRPRLGSRRSHQESHSTLNAPRTAGSTHSCRCTRCCSCPHSSSGPRSTGRLLMKQQQPYALGVARTAAAAACTAARAPGAKSAAAAAARAFAAYCCPCSLTDHPDHSRPHSTALNRTFDCTADLITHMRSLDAIYRATCTEAELALLPPSPPPWRSLFTSSHVHHMWTAPSRGGKRGGKSGGAGTGSGGGGGTGVTSVSGGYGTRGGPGPAGPTGAVQLHGTRHNGNNSPSSSRHIRDIRSSKGSRSSRFSGIVHSVEGRAGQRSGHFHAPGVSTGGAEYEGARDEGDGAGGASSEGAGAEGTRTGGASSGGAGAEGTGTRGASSGVAGVGGACPGGAKSGGARSGGAGAGVACTDLGELRRYIGLQITRDRVARTITFTRSGASAVQASVL
ncbi:unnamed protein product, partial [Closterium sp. NIES-54]